MKSLLLILRRTAQIAISVLLMQIVLVISMVVALDVAVSAGPPALVSAYDAAQKGVDFGAVAQFSSDADAFWTRLDPVLEQLDFRWVGAISSGLGFLALGFFLNRLFRARARLGGLVGLSLLVGINPVLAAQSLVDRGVAHAALAPAFQVLLLLLQLLALEAGAWLSERTRRRPAAQ